MHLEAGADLEGAEVEEEEVDAGVTVAEEEVGVVAEAEVRVFCVASGAELILFYFIL